MTRYWLLLPFLIILCSIAAASESGAAFEDADFQEPAFAGKPMFSVDTDLYLGQKKRRRGSGGRVWSNLYYDKTTLHPQDTGKIKPETYGVQIGFDAVRRHGIYSTFFANIQQSNIESSVVDSKVENYLFGYGKYFYLRGCHFGYLASLGYDEYKVYADAESLRGRGMQANAFGEFGIDFLLGTWAFKPFYDLQYSFLYHGRIGDADAAEKISDQHGHSFAQHFGMRTNWKPLDNFEFQLRTTWIHEYLNNPQPFYNLHFSEVQGTMTPAVMFFDGYTGRDWAWLGVGTKLECDFNVYVFADYDVLVNAYHTSHLVNLGLCFGW